MGLYSNFCLIFENESLQVIFRGSHQMMEKKKKKKNSVIGFYWRRGLLLMPQRNWMSQGREQWRKWCLQKQRSTLLSEVLYHFTLQKRETATGKAHYKPDIYHSVRQSNTGGCFFVIFVSVFDKIRNTGLTSNKAQAARCLSGHPPPPKSTKERRGKCIPNGKSLFLLLTIRIIRGKRFFCLVGGWMKII